MDVHDYGPIRWFLSRIIVRNLRKVIANSFVSNELDIRDWMPLPEDGRQDAGDEVWFDYIADTGDSSRVMLKIAERMLQPFKLAPSACTELPQDAQHAINADLGTQDIAALPRGEFLFMGGDTAYVVADEATIWDRVVAPINRAAAQHPDGNVRNLYGIPGNHDHYDDLVGFNRMFRKPPARGIAPPPRQGDPPRKQVLPITGFRRVQDASYVRIKLPGWELWGADFWIQPLDYRQQAYFRPDGEGPPKNLILCTQTPPIVLSKYVASDTDKKSYERLLGPNFDVLARYEGAQDGARDHRLLLLSGDTHHYARFQPDAKPPTAAGAARREEASPEPSPHMVCVVSGGGGAFTHPTETELGSIEPMTTYPQRPTSRSNVARRLARVFPTMYTAGWVWLIGGLLSLLFACTAPSELRAMACPALTFWGLVVAALGVIYGAHLVTVWAREQHQLNYVERSQRNTRSGKVVNGWYRRVRNSSVVRKLAYWGLLRSSGLVLRITVVVVAVLIPYWLRGYWISGISGTSLACTGAGLALVLGSTMFAWKVGGLNLATGKKIVVTTLGVIHGAFQVLLPLVAFRWGFCLYGLLVLALWVVFGVAARFLYHRGLVPSILLALLWVAQGGVLLYLVWSHNASTELAGWYRSLAGFGLGALIVPIQFSWYLLVAGSFDGHNNEIASAMRSTQYKQWIRFHVTRDRVTGYVIAIDDPCGPPTRKGQPNPAVEPKLVDAFALDAIRDDAGRRVR